jgi:5-methyltetrahydrofolate--homocysteine methyltransferase
MQFILDYKRRGEKPKLEIYIDPRKKNAELINGEQKSEPVIKSNVKQDNPVPAPPFLGSRIIDDISLDTIYPYINEVALFRGSWNVYKDRSKPDSEYDSLLKKEIYPEFNELKLKAKREKLLIPKIIYGYFPCQSAGNNLIIYKPKDEKEIYTEWKGIDLRNIDKTNVTEWIRFSFPRQGKDRHLCISDYFKAVDSGTFDVAAFQIVTVGGIASETAKILYEENKYRDYLYFHGFSVETTEALAEYWHKVIREELKINETDSEDMKKIFQQGYQGSRYSFGYPACPNLEDNKLLFELLKPERIGITLSEEWQMVPEQSTNAIVVHHPEAKYFFIK